MWKHAVVFVDVELDQSTDRGDMANSKSREHSLRVLRSCYDCAVRDLAVLILHLLATVARLAGPGVDGGEEIEDLETESTARRKTSTPGRRRQPGGVAGVVP